MTALLDLVMAQLFLVGRRVSVTHVVGAGNLWQLRGSRVIGIGDVPSSFVRIRSGGLLDTKTVEFRLAEMRVISKLCTCRFVSLLGPPASKK